MKAWAASGCVTKRAVPGLEVVLKDRLRAADGLRLCDRRLLHNGVASGKMNDSMDTPEQEQAASGLAAQIVQVMPWIQKQIDKLKPLIDQPIVRIPFTMPLITSQVVAAGQNNFPLPSSDFALSLEYPFEVWQFKFSQDPGHTFRDWRVAINDNTFAQDLQRNPAMVALILSDNTGAWRLDPFPYIVRPKGGGMNIRVDNLDTVNPITVDIALQGYLMVPR